MSGLLGAYVLGACTAAEADAVETHLGRCVACSTDAAELALAVPPPVRSATGEAGDAPPPVGAASLDAVLAAALAVRPAAPGTPVRAEAGPVRAHGWQTPTYGSRVAALDRLLVELAPADWTRPSAAGWSVRDLVLHLYAVDGLLLAALGEAAGTGDAGHDLERPDEDPVTRTEAVLAATREWPAEQAQRRWYERATLLCTAVADASSAAGAGAAGGPEPPVVTAGGWPTIPVDHLTARGFETWIHTRDIAAAAGVTVPDPGEDELHTMADLALRVLAGQWAAAVAPAGPAVLTVTLTGPGGGTWSLDPSGVAERQPGHAPVEPSWAAGLLRAAGPATAAGPTAVPAAANAVTLGIVPFCLLAGGRATVPTVAAQVEGDERLAAELLALAPSLAGP
ncbi:hypothetical protein CC117_19755 [Parafrankia colletiae]|uniref:Mycothiol-dependent maleylpyruvate isomerase metal-binding domain-containing protein n=1 Tax=Parafrankia colletiae TaxID=573497 RepID=A0A1S1QP64_9ACTN|nr:hypothetical protein CC117_19755 [Parafrankia colletiae]